MKTSYKILLGLAGVSLIIGIIMYVKSHNLSLILSPTTDPNIISMDFKSNGSSTKIPIDITKIPDGIPNFIAPTKNRKLTYELLVNNQMHFQLFDETGNNIIGDKTITIDFSKNSSSIVVF
jgi:hypothetical protein